MTTSAQHTNRTVLISGAGIAGPALAYWLRRYGFRPTVVERAPAPRPGGYKIDIRGAAVEVCRRMGVWDEIRRASTEMTGMSFVDAAGRRVASMGEDMVGFRAGEDEEVLRGDLARILYTATLHETEYLFDDSITSLTERADGVTVTFERAGTRTFDLVVGADGQHSRVRALAFGPEQDFARDLGHYVAVYTVPNDLRLDREELLYSVPGRTVNLYSTARGDGAKAAFYFSSPPLRYDRRDVAGQQRILADVMAGQGWQVPALLDHMSDAPDWYFDALSVIEMDRWHTGRVALLGDAAFGASPASGQGTSMALVGAYVLAGELAAAHGDHRAGFAGYEREMRDFVTRNQAMSRHIKHIVTQSSAALRFTYLMIRMMNHLPWRNMMIGMTMKEIVRASNAITLRDYRSVRRDASPA